MFQKLCLPGNPGLRRYLHCGTETTTATAPPETTVTADAPRPGGRLARLYQPVEFLLRPGSTELVWVTGGLWEPAEQGIKHLGGVQKPVLKSVGERR